MNDKEEAADDVDDGSNWLNDFAHDNTTEIPETSDESGNINNSLVEQDYEQSLNDYSDESDVEIQKS